MVLRYSAAIRFVLPQRIVHPLQYASPPAAPGDMRTFRVVALLFALLGILANLGLIAASVRSVHSASVAYQELTRNPRAYGRDIAPSTIATLRVPVRLWASQAMLIVAATLGLLLAISLLFATVQLHQNLLASSRYLSLYTRLKPFGAAASTAAFFWFGYEDLLFWVTASRHWPVGAGPPVFFSSVLFACALIPWWWVRSNWMLRRG